MPRWARGWPGHSKCSEAGSSPARGTNWQSTVDNGRLLCHRGAMSHQATLGVSDEEFASIVANSISVAEVVRKLGRAIVGTSYRLIHREVARCRLDTSHWKGQRHGTTRQETIAWDQVLVPSSPYPINNRRKQRLLKEGLLSNKCSICGTAPFWQGKPLVLVLDHINGVRNDHRLENLRLVCPNCDSQLETFCGRNKRPR